MPQRHIILFRHANALADSTSGADIDRELSPLGLQQAEQSAVWIKQHLSDVPRILCSPAKRAQATAAALVKQYAHANVHLDSRIYEATPAILMRILDEDTHTPLVLIGHNPGFESLLALLSTGQSSSVRGMGTAAVAWLTAPRGNVSPGCAELKQFHSC